MYKKKLHSLVILIPSYNELENLKKFLLRLKKDFKEKKSNDLNNICDECRKEDESVFQNLIMTGFKLCESCRVSKTIFPL